MESYENMYYPPIIRKDPVGDYVEYLKRVARKDKRPISVLNTHKLCWEVAKSYGLKDADKIAVANRIKAEEAV